MMKRGIMLSKEIIDIIYEIMKLQEIVIANKIDLNEKFIKDYLEQKNFIINRLNDVVRHLEKNNM